MKIYLIRHAKTIDAEEGLSQRPNAMINLKLIDKSLVKNIVVDKVYSSPLPRATKTAEILFKNYEIVDYIYEYVRPKNLDGVSKDEARKFWEWGLLEYRKDANWKFEGSESFTEIKNRTKKFLDFLKSIKNKYKRIAVVGHAIFFRHFLGLVATGSNYDQKVYLDLGRYIDCDNLEIKEIEI